MNLGEEESVIPNRQADITPPGGPEQLAEHVGERDKALAKVSSDLVDAKLGARVPMGALMQLVFVACTADLITWGGMPDLTERERDQLYSRMSPGPARVLRKLITADQPKTCETCETSVPRGGDRRSSWETCHFENSWKEFAAISRSSELPH